MTLTKTPADIWAQIETLLTHLNLFQSYTQLITEIEKQSAPNELHDRKLRLQMTTLLSRPESLYALLIIYLAPRAGANDKRWRTFDLPYDRRGPVTKSMLAVALWECSILRHRTTEPTRAQRVQAARIIDAALAFNLAERVPGPDRKRKPVTATPKLENLIRLLAVKFEKCGLSEPLPYHIAACAGYPGPYTTKSTVEGPIRVSLSPTPSSQGS